VGEPIGVSVAALTDVGMRRATNQDAHALLLADAPELLQDRGHFLMVADGMGAHAAGELASKLSADGVSHLYHKYREVSPPEALLRAIRETNTEINRRGMANPDFHNMGTTSSVLLLLPQGALAAHVGDSRVYRLRGDTICQLTFDHSLQWELRASGQLPAGADISAVVPKNVITRSLGPNPNVEIDLEGPHPIALGDVYLLCSDGLTGRVEDEEIGAILTSLSPAEAAQALLDLANLRGGPDNVTVLISRVTGPELVAGGAALEPLRMGAAPATLGAHPAVWAVSGICLLAAAALAGLGHFAAAGIALAGGVLAALVGLIWRGVSLSRSALGRNRILGRGPYTTTTCTPNHELVRKLAATLDELREAARDGSWTINWEPLDESCRQAQAADEAGNFVEAVRHNCRAISYVMSQLRAQHDKRAGDSDVL
jgi:serine/threonine protein phosphatase PrpC